MTDTSSPAGPAAAVDVGEYCRRVEDHLTKVNGGHLVRIVGPAFDLVRGWADAGVPLSVVYRGIDLKADRHREGRAKRPLRLEFCAGDVQAVFDHWRRAVGLTTGAEADVQDEAAPAAGATDPGEASEATARRRSLSRHLDRAIDRLSRAIGRIDLPEGLRGDCERVLEALAAMRETSARVRGAARDEAAARLAALDQELGTAARLHAPAAWLDSLRADAAADLAPFRTRLVGDAWQHSLDVTVDRLLRDRLGLPFLSL